MSAECWRHRSHIPLQSINTYTVYWALELAVCCAMTLQAVVAEDVMARVRDKRDQDLAAAADGAGTHWLQQLSHAAALIKASSRQLLRVLGCSVTTGCLTPG